MKGAAASYLEKEKDVEKAAMKNKNVLVPGLSIGIIGYAVGNYLGFIISQLLEHL